MAASAAVRRAEIGAGSVALGDIGDRAGRLGVEIADVAGRVLRGVQEKVLDFDPSIAFCI